jgi:ABC-type phosphate transport system substrate-binding protein
MKLRLLFTLSILLNSLSVNALVLVVNESSSINSLTKRQVVDIYMGRYSTFPNGEHVLPIDLPQQSDVKKQFYLQLVQQNEKKINAYWARLLFSGSAKPPIVIDTVDEIIRAMQKNKEMIAYIPESEVRKGLKVVFNLVPN